MQKDNGQTVYENGTSTHGPQQPAQETTHPLTHNKQPRKPAAGRADSQGDTFLSLGPIQGANQLL